MISRKFALPLLVAAFMASASLSAVAQGAGTGSARDAAASANSNARIQPGTPNATTGDINALAATHDETTVGLGRGERTSPAPPIGVGHAANGLPIGSTGSGPGSPEHPIDSGSR